MTTNESLFLQSEHGERDFAGYRNFLKHCQEFAQDYETVQRLWFDAPLYLETDAFLNYLFHDAENTPSFEFNLNREPRKLGKAERVSEILRWAPKFAAWVSSSDDPRWRERYSKLVQSRLERQDRRNHRGRRPRSGRLSKLHERPQTKQILNSANNTIEAIQKAWKALLHGPARE